MATTTGLWRRRGHDEGRLGQRLLHVDNADDVVDDDGGARTLSVLAEPR